MVQSKREKMIKKKDIHFLFRKNMMGANESDKEEEDDELETETNLLYNVAEVCSQEVVDIGQGMIDIWELTDRKTSNYRDIKRLASIHLYLFSYLVSCVRQSLVPWYPGEVSVDSQLGQRGADGVAGVRHSSISAGGV